MRNRRRSPQPQRRSHPPNGRFLLMTHPMMMMCRSLRKRSNRRRSKRSRNIKRRSPWSSSRPWRRRMACPRPETNPCTTYDTSPGARREKKYRHAARPATAQRPRSRRVAPLGYCYFTFRVRASRTRGYRWATDNQAARAQKQQTHTRDSSLARARERRECNFIVVAGVRAPSSARTSEPSDLFDPSVTQMSHIFTQNEPTVD